MHATLKITEYALKMKQKKQWYSHRKDAPQENTKSFHQMQWFEALRETISMFNCRKQILLFCLIWKRRICERKKALSTEEILQLLEVIWVRSIVQALGKAK